MMVQEHVDSGCNGKLVYVATIFSSMSEEQIFICNECGEEYHVAVALGLLKSSVA